MCIELYLRIEVTPVRVGVSLIQDSMSRLLREQLPGTSLHDIVKFDMDVRFRKDNISKSAGIAISKFSTDMGLCCKKVETSTLHMV